MASSSKLSSSSYSPFETNSANLRDDSFSSYLALIRQSFSTELASGANSRRSSFQAAILPPPKRASKESGELDVFDAEKYFNGSLDEFQGYPDSVSEATTTSRSKTAKKSAATRSRSRSSNCSETSTNSHSMLLLHDRRLQSQQPSPAPRRRSFLDVLRCSCSKKTAVKVEDDSDADRSNGGKLPGVFGKTLHSESSSDLFEIGSVSMNSHPVCEPSEVSIEWSVTTAGATNFSSAASESERASEGRKARRSSGFLGFGCVSERAVRSGAAAAEADRVGSLERYHVMMDLESVSVARSEAGQPRRASLGYRGTCAVMEEVSQGQLSGRGCPSQPPSLPSS